MDDPLPIDTAVVAPAAEETRPRTSFVATVREALRGTHLDYTVGSIPRAIVLLAVPMVIEMVMESLFAVVDIFWVARLKDSGAVAIVALTESLLMIVYALGMGLAMAATATVARRIGEKNRDAASHYAVQAIALGALVALPIALVGGFFAPQLLVLVGGKPETVAQYGRFAQIMLGGNATILLLILVNSVFRGAGDAAIAMRTLWIANGINLLLDPCFIFGLGPFPQLGVVGAAVATNCGRGIGVLYQLWRLSRGTPHLAVKREHLRVDPAQMMTILRLSGSGILQSLIGTTSWLGLVKVLTSFGNDALAGYQIGLRIVIFGLLPSWGVSSAAATMVGQSLGAGKPDRAEKAVWLAGFYNFCFLSLVGLAFFVGAPLIIGWFTEMPEVARYAVACLRTVSAGFIFFAYGMVLVQSFNGAGDTWTPTLINFFVFWTFEIPLAALLAFPLGIGPQGVFYAITIAFSIFAIVGAAIFRRGKWKTRKV